MYPSSIPTSPDSLPKVTKKSARAYGSTIACRPISDSWSCEARLVVDLVVADEAEDVADHGDVRVEDVSGLSGRPSARPPKRPPNAKDKRRFLRKGRGAERLRASRSTFKGIPSEALTKAGRISSGRATSTRPKEESGRKGREGRASGAARSARASGDGRDAGGARKTGADAGGSQVRDGARRARVLVLRDERRVVRVVGREELRAVRERLDAVDVPERPAQRQRREQGEDGGADETGLSRRRSLRLRPSREPISRRPSRDSCRRPCPAPGTAPSFTMP